MLSYTEKPKGLLYFICALILSAIVIYRVLLCFSYKTELSIGESNNIWNALKAVSGKGIYSNPEKPPFEIFQYTPLSQYPVVVACKFLNSNDKYYIHNILISGRLISLVFNLLSLVLIYKLARTFLNLSATYALILLTTFFSLMTHLSYAIRPDSMVLLLTLSCLYFFILYFKNNSVISLVLASIFPVLGFYTKQDCVFIIIPCGLFLFVNLEIKKLVRYSGVMILFFIIITYIFYSIYENDFVISISKGLNNGYSVISGYWVFNRFQQVYHELFFISAVSIAVCLFRYQRSQWIWFFALAGALYLLLALFSSLKAGAWINYYTPFLLFGCFCFVVILQEGLSSGSDKVAALFLRFSLIYFAIFVPLDQMSQRQMIYLMPYSVKFAEQKRKYDELYNIAGKINQEIPGGTVYTTDNLLKLFLHDRSIMPNTEYYGTARFNYQYYFSGEKNSDLPKAVILNSTEKIETDPTLSVFKINPDDYFFYKNLGSFITYQLKK